MSRAELRDLWDTLNAAQPRMRAVARQMTNLNDYDGPCRLAASLKESMQAIEEMLERDDHPAFTAKQEEQGTLA